jgi:DNA-binding MarR family transcriptional regulator
MTIQATAWAWEQRGLSPEEKLVLLALSDDSGECPPPDPGSIAARCEMSTEDLHEILTSLENGGLIEADYRTVTR